MYNELDIIDSSIHATITEARAYYNNEELEIPAIPLDLPQNHLPVIRDTRAQ